MVNPVIFCMRCVERGPNLLMGIYAFTEILTIGYCDPGSI